MCGLMQMLRDWLCREQRLRGSVGKVGSCPLTLGSSCAQAAWGSRHRGSEETGLKQVMEPLLATLV